ncbi:hypothetical protein TNCV_3156061 [Trichonephila clavipes]|nr:hypothetical protein TNCV_3156061 [Trichonephila clavipes]
MKAKLSGEIGKIVGRTHSSTQRVINNYTSSKSVISKPHLGRPSKLTLREKRLRRFTLDLKQIIADTLSGSEFQGNPQSYIGYSTLITLVIDARWEEAGRLDYASIGAAERQNH